MTNPDELQALALLALVVELEALGFTIAPLALDIL